MKNKLVFILLFISVVFFGQYGWTDAKVYLKDGQVLDGEAKITLHTSAKLFIPKIFVRRDRLVFRTGKGEERQQYKSSEIDKAEFQYNTGKSLFVPVKTKEKSKQARFMRVVYQGEKVILYSRLTKYAVSSVSSTWTEIANEYWIHKSNEKGMHNIVDGAFKMKSYKNRLKDLFADCPVLISKIEGEEFNRHPSYLETFVKEYDKCVK